MQYIWRIGQAKDLGVIDSTWTELTPRLNTELGIDETEWRGECAWRKKYRVMQQAYDDLFSKLPVDNSQLNEIVKQKQELEKAKIKLQTEKLEYNRWLREESRDELIAEKIIAAVNNLKPLRVPEKLYTPKLYADTLNHTSGVLCFGDEHYATEFTIKGLYGEIINQYNPDIFEQRMWALFNEVISIVNKENLNTLYIFALGDFCDGILRYGQLMKLRYGVVEGSVRYADFISSWLNELSRFIHIKYQMTYGNHTELRMLSAPKGTFKDDNTGLFVREIIKTRLKDNPNFEMTINPTGLIFENIEGFNVLGIHGEVKSMENAIKDFSNTYNTDINILIGGHMHHYKAETVGINKDVINVPSIIGIDDYAINLNKTSNPGASLFLVEKNKGVSVEYKIKL
jgi:hypothetical protein